MTPGNDRMIRDLGIKISDRLEEILQREVNLAQHVLHPHDVVLMVMKIAAGVGGSAILAALQMRKEDADVDEAWAVFARSLAVAVDERKASYLRILAALEGRQPSNSGTSS